MADPTVTVMVMLALAALAAGFVDAVVGGGGLIQLPALLVGLPSAAPAQLLATIDLGSISGTTVSSAIDYGRIKLDPRTFLPMMVLAFVGSFCGALLASRIPREAFEPIVLIVLVAVFGSLAAAAIPLALGIFTVAVTMGVVYLLSMLTTMSVFVTSTVSMFGIALAIDYSLFVLMRFREELRAGRDPAQATDAAMGTSGLAVVLSGLTVIASLTGI